MLFSSVGFMKVDAQISITLPQTKTAEDVTITFTSSTKKFTSPTSANPSYPMMGGTTPTVSKDGATATYKFKTSTTDPTPLQIAKGVPTPSDLWGDITLTLNGKVSSFVAGEAAKDFILSVKSLSFTNNGELATLKVDGANKLQKLDASKNKLKDFTGAGLLALEELNLSENELASFTISHLITSLKSLNLSGNQFTSLNLSSLSKLTTLDVENNKLESLTVPASLTTLNVDGNKLRTVFSLPEKCTVTWGTQDLTASPSYVIRANDKMSVSYYAGNTLGLPNGSYTFSDSASDWKVKDNHGNYGTVSTVPARKLDDDNTDSYMFYDATTKSYISGDYEAVIIDAKDRRFKVRFTVTPAKFNLKVVHPVKGTLKGVCPSRGVTFTLPSTSSGDAAVEVFQGDVWEISYEPEAGYEFDGFTANKALDLSSGYEWSKNPVACVVNGKFTDLGADDLAPEISVKYKGSDKKITITKVDEEQGLIVVQKKDANGNLSPVQSGDEVPYGTKLKISVTPKTSYLGSLFINGTNFTYQVTDPKVLNTSDPIVKDDYEVKSDLEITASFVKVKEYAISALVNNKSVGAGEAVKQVRVIAAKQGATTTTTSVQTINETTKKAKLQSGEIYQLEFEIKNDEVLHEILFDGKAQLQYTQSESKYYVSSFAPTQNGVIYIHTKKLSAVDVKLANLNSSGQQVYVYDGNEKALDFTTDPAGFEKDVKVEYQLTSGGAYGEKKPVNAGNYQVRYSMKAEGNYASIPENTATLIIKKAVPEFETVPTISVDAENNKYVLKDGKVVFGNRTLTGEFTTTTDVNDTKSQLVDIKFTPKGEDAVNFETVTIQKEYTPTGKEALAKQIIKMADGQPEGVSAELLEGGTKPVKWGTQFAVGTKLVILVHYPKTAQFANVKLQSTLLKSVQPAENANYSNAAENIKAFDYTVNENSKGSEAFKVDLGDLPKFDYIVTTTNKEYVEKYQVTPIEFVKGNLNIVKDSDDPADPATFGRPIDDNIIVTYKQNGNELKGLPTNVGTYTVCVRIKADLSKGYNEFYEEFPNILKIQKATPIVKAWPKASPIAQGQTLKQATLLGGSSTVSGTFNWDEPTTQPKDGDVCVVVFTPDDTQNYEIVKSSRGTEGPSVETRVKVTVCDYQVITFGNPKNGIISVIDSEGHRYESGEQITKGTKLYITTSAETGFVQNSLTVNGKSFSNPYTVGDESIAVEAEFKEGVVQTEYKISFKQAAGTVLSYSNDGWVNRGDSYSFKVQAYSADLNRLVVKTSDGTILSRGNDGYYTIPVVLQNLTVEISLPNPTSLKVTVPAEYKDEEGNLIGTVNWTGGSTNCYYGETVQLTATPEAGVEFKGWKGLDFTSTSKVVNFPVYRNMEIEAVFEGEAVVVDPDKECTVKLPTMGTVNGVSLNKDGVQIVEKGGKFEFEVLTYKDDKDKLVVKANGVVLKPGEDGKTYTLPEVKENTTIEISLPNPTRLKVRVPGEIKNDKGYLLGRVEVYGLNSDSTCLYNEMIQLVAYPETGVKFSHWSDDKTKTASFRELYVLDNMEIKAVFEGTPTGIEDIMAASIATGKGCVWVRGIANADVTIVSIAGRVQARQRISGDTRINVPAGIYVILLESGSDVKRVKVIVK